MSSISVIVPTIPPRADLLSRALVSIDEQDTDADVSVIVEIDYERTGSARTRNRALSRVETEWIAFLDDDDEYMPHHLSTLLATAGTTDADHVYSWYDMKYMSHDPLSGTFGRPFNPRNVRTVHLQSTLVRTSLMNELGGLIPEGERDIVGGSDTRFIRSCAAAGASIVHVPERTWYWRWDRRGTAGLAQRWNPGMLRYDPTW